MNGIRPKILKGALVQLGDGLVGPQPNVIVFQFNPESISRTLSPYNPPPEQATEAQKQGSGDNVQPYDPGETFNLSLEFDATDDLAEPDGHPVAVASGIADRIAALEQLLYPSADQGSLVVGAVASLAGGLGGGVVGGAVVGAAASAAGAVAGALGMGGGSAPAQRPQVPIVLFVWGPGRVVPVRLTSFSVDEQAFSPTLYPVRAKVTLGMQVLGPAFFQQRRSASPSKSLSPAEALAEAAYGYTRKQKSLLARANVTADVQAVLAMLPM